MDCAKEDQEDPFHSATKGEDVPPGCRSTTDLQTGQSGTNHEDTLQLPINISGSKSRVNHHVRRWSSNFGEQVRRSWHDNEKFFMVVKVQRFSWMEKYFTFYRVHAAYYLTLGSLGTLVIYMVPLSDCKRLSFVDAIYTAFSAACGTGLQTVRSPDLTRLHNFVLLVLLNLGAPVLVSLFPVCVRRFFFHLCIKQSNQQGPSRPECTRTTTSSLSKDPNCKLNDLNYGGEFNSEQGLKHVDLLRAPFDSGRSPTDALNAAMPLRDLKHVDDMGDHQTQKIDIRGEPNDDLGEKWRMFVDAKQALRTLEYRALVALSWVVICFFFGSQIIGFISGAIYFLASRRDATVVKGKEINPTFFAFFTAVTTFTNAGYNINNDSMMSFQKSSFLLILYTILASLGNTMYAPSLRLLVWIHYRLVGEKDKVVYEYLLRHPRRCFTNLFPRSQTIWLVAISLSLTILQLIVLCTLEWNAALGGMKTLEKLVAGVYQAVGTRNGGGNVVTLHHLAPAVLFIFLVMMYISVYPSFLFLQTSKDEYDDTELTMSHSYKEKTNPDQMESILVVQSRRLLARDTSYLFFAILVLCLSENRSIKMDPLNFSLFNIVFEVISAYGSIGLSMGYNCDLKIDKTHACEKVPYSFSGTWTSTGKLMLVMVMFLGRHRGLPDNIDSAIRLPTKLVEPTVFQTPQRKCEEYMTEVELRMHPQVQLAQKVTPDFTADRTSSRLGLCRTSSRLGIKVDT